MVSRKEKYMSCVLGTAISIAAYFHNGQIDKNGDAYILHPLRIMMKMDNFEEKVVAILHDVLEDSDCEFLDIEEKIELSQKMKEALLAITKMPNEKYFEYIKRVNENLIARKVKIADLVDNLSRKGTPSSLRKRYYEALNFLCGADELPHDRKRLASFFGFEVYIDRLWPEIEYLEVNYQDEINFMFSLKTEKYPPIKDYQYTEKVFMEWYFEFKSQIRKVIEEEKYYELPDWENM